MRPMTKDNVKAAMAGESQAHIKYLAFAAVAEKEGKAFLYDGRCRDRHFDDTEPSVIRLRMPDTGDIVLDDLVKGRITVPVASLDELAPTGEGLGGRGAAFEGFGKGEGLGQSGSVFEH